MPSITEGLTEAGVPAGPSNDPNTEAGFNARLGAKVGRGGTEQATPAERRHVPATPDADSPARIKQQVRSTEHSTRIQDGLSVPSEEKDRYGNTPADRERIRRERHALDRDPAYQATFEEGRRMNAQEQAEKVELEQLREDRAIEEFNQASVYSGSDEELIPHLVELKSRVTPERFEESLLELFGLNDENVAEDDFRWSEMAELEQKVEHQATLERTKQIAAQVVEKTTTVARAELESLRSAINMWKRAERLTADQARARINRVEQELGIDLMTTAAAQGHAAAVDLLRAGDATLVEQASAERIRAFKENFRDEKTTSVSAGLEVLGANGYQPVVPRGEVGSQISPERIIGRATRSRTTAADIKRGVIAKDEKERGWEDLQRIAGENAERLRPKPQNELY